MKTIVIVFVRMCDAKLPARQQIDGTSQEIAASEADEANHTDQSPIHTGSVSPFWTWFIENPRPQSSRSSRSLADLIFAA